MLFCSSFCLIGGWCLPKKLKLRMSNIGVEGLSLAPTERNLKSLLEKMLD